MGAERAKSRGVLAVVLSLLLLAGLAALFAFALSRQVQQAPEVQQAPVPERRVLKFGKTPTISLRKAYEVYSIFLDLVSEDLPCCKLELVLAPSYEACVNMLASGEIDLAWLGTATYVEHRGRVPMTPLVRPVWEGNTSYRGVIFTTEDTGISTVEDLRGKRLAVVDRESASGYIYPALVLRAHGLKVPQDFAAIDYLGSHDAVVVAVLLGEYDAGAVYERAFASVADRGKRVKLRVLASTDPIPGEPIVAGARVEAALVEQLRAAFLAVRRDRVEHPLLEDFFAFEVASDRDYDNVLSLEEK